MAPCRFLFTPGLDYHFTKAAVNDISVYFLEGTGRKRGLGPCPSLEAWHAEVDPSVLPGLVACVPREQQGGVFAARVLCVSADEDVSECVLMSVCFYIDTSMGCTEWLHIHCSRALVCVQAPLSEHMGVPLALYRLLLE